MSTTQQERWAEFDEDAFLRDSLERRATIADERDAIARIMRDELALADFQGRAS